MRRHWWIVMGLGLLVVGIGLVLSSASGTDFGWFAYTPLDNEVRFSSEFVILSRGRLFGCLVVGLGLLVIAGGIGYRAGRRSRPAC